MSSDSPYSRYIILYLTIWNIYYNISMSQFFTSPDVAWLEDERKGNNYVPTIYTVEANIAGMASIECVTCEHVIRILNEAPVVERRYLQRCKWQPHTWIDLMRLLRTMPARADEIDTTNSSNRQLIWSGDGKITDIRGMMWRSEEIQYPPFGQYFMTTDALLDELEKSWRKLDTGSISHGFPAKMHHFYRND